MKFQNHLWVRDGLCLAKYTFSTQPQITTVQIKAFKNTSLLELRTGVFQSAFSMIVALRGDVDCADEVLMCGF